MRNFLGLGTAFFIAGLLVLSASGVQRQTPQWRSGIDLVVVDASVLDYDRRPVRGLTVADFTILEDGHPRSVATISEINASDTVTPIGVAVPAGVWVREVPADVESNAIPAGGRLLALVLDDALPMAPGEGVRARELALDVIDRLAPSDVAAVVFTSGREQNQNFTADQARLRSAVGRYHPRTDLRFDRLDPRQGAAPPLYFAATATLRNLVRGLGVLGPRRKAILWVSAGIPLELGKVFGSDVWSSQLRDEWRDLLAAAGGANVTFYDLDPGGLRGQTIDLHIGPTSWNTTGEDISPGGTREYGAVNRRFLLDVAANTGGIAVTGSNDPGPGIEQLFTETGSYYLLGFESAFPPGKDVRRLEVRVKRPGVTVHSRTQYSREAARASAEPATEKALLSGALGGLLPVSDIGLRVAATPFVGGPREEPTVAVVVGIDEATPARQKTTSDDLHVVISAYDAGGQPAGSVTTHVKVGMPAGDENVRYEVLASLALKPGRYELRVTAASMAAKESGGLISSVDVPDFARARLSLSGLVLATTPAAMATPRDALRSFLSVTPSSRRVFAPDENVMALVRAYPSAGGRSPVPALVVQVIDVNGTIVFRADVPPSGDAPARTAGTEYRLALPLRCLGPGSYLLKAVANRGNDTAERNLRFEVR